MVSLCFNAALHLYDRCGVAEFMVDDRMRG
jgi:hypothetical protein